MSSLHTPRNPDMRLTNLGTHSELVHDRRRDPRRPDPAARLPRASGPDRRDPRLPPERELAEELGVSRGTLRKALADLEVEGLIWRHVGRGTFVGNRPVETVQDLGEVTRRTNPAGVMEARLRWSPSSPGWPPCTRPRPTSTSSPSAFGRAASRRLAHLRVLGQPPAPSGRRGDGQHRAAGAVRQPEHDPTHRHLGPPAALRAAAGPVTPQLRRARPDRRRDRGPRPWRRCRRDARPPALRARPSPAIGGAGPR